MSIEQTKYAILSIPKSIRFTCPYCKKEVEIGVGDIDSDILWYGGIIECSECHRDVELTDWEYD